MMTATEYYTKILGEVGARRDYIIKSCASNVVNIEPALLPALDALIATIKHHEPKPYGPTYFECHGCDQSSWGEGNFPVAPCSTLETIAQKLGIEQ